MWFIRASERRLSRMKTFRSLSEIQRYLEQNTQVILDNSAQLESFLAYKMRDAVIEHVYSVYEPEVYERRGTTDGLADERNMAITSVDITGNRVRVTFENLAEGADNLSGEYIGDLIEFGEGHSGKTWSDPDGAWAKPRPFSTKAAEDIATNPSTLIKILKSELGNAGFKIR